MNIKKHLAMKKIYILLASIILLALTSLSNNVYAQASTGPSDGTLAPPTNATDVGKVLCAGTGISITGPQDVGGIDFAVYHWYKLDASGNQQLTSVTTRTYTETPTTAGYYNYVLVTENANGCTSPVSDPFKIFVLPPLTATITTPTSIICTVVGTSTLTANPTPATGYVYTYQWTRNGVNIPLATGNTYAVANESTPATVTFGVIVSYVLNPTCTVTATKDIVVSPAPTKPSITAN
jgi:hypothetical protein